MAQLNVTTSFPGIALPLRTWPGLDRLAGATAMSATFEILSGPLAGGRIVLGGSGFAYDGQEMPSAGTVTSITLLQPGDFATIGVLNGLSAGAAVLRAANDLWALLLGGADTLNGGSGEDRLIGFDGNDLLQGGEEADRLEGGAGRDTLRGGTGSDMLLGGAGDDVILPGYGFDIVRAGAGDDIIRLEEEEETASGEIIDGGAGFDTIVVAAPGHDMFMLGYARLIGIEAIRFETTTRISLTPDQLVGIEQIELAWDPAVDGRDVVSLEIWGDGHVALDGFDLSAAPGTRLRVELWGDLVLYGRNAANGFANDWIIGTSSDDTMYLGSGNDSVVTEFGNDWIFGEAGADTLDGGPGNDYLNGGSGADSLIGAADHDDLRGGDGDDQLDGGEGHDELEGGNGNDRLVGGAGDDDLVGNGGADTMMGGVGSDTYSVDDAGDVVMESGSGLGGRDLINSSISWTLGTGQEDLKLSAGATGTGNGLANRITGSMQADTIMGGAGADTLNGSYGADELTGGSGADRFRYQLIGDSGVAPGSRDMIKDFNRAQGDRIDLSYLDAIQAGDGNNNAFTNLAVYSLAEAPAAGSLRYLQSGAVTVIFGYVDSVAGADFAIEVTGMGAAQLSDFIM